MSEWTAYHTALAHGQTDNAPSRRMAEWADGIALCHDAFEPLPAAFDQCDVIYGEPPWKHGFDKFNERAGVTEYRSWNDLMDATGRSIRERAVPWVLTCGKQALRRWPEPDEVYDTVLNRAPAMIACWGTSLSSTAHASDAIQDLCARYSCIGDPFCGYGRTAFYAREQGKRFVVADHNPTCIGYMADHFPGCQAAV